MKQKILFLFTLFISLNTFAQVANQPSNVLQCDDDNDGFSQFDLTIQNSQILGSQNPMDYSISFHVSLNNAETNNNPIVNSNNYFNVTNPQQIYVRLEDNSTGNYDTTVFDINVISSPIINPTYDNHLVHCDDLDANFMSTNDDSTSFDLTQEIIEITGGNTDYSVTFYESNTDALLDVNMIGNATSYTNAINPQTLYVRVFDNAFGCASFTTVTLNVLPNPTPSPNVDNLQECDDNNDGFYTFDLTQNEAYIINGEPGQTITYFTSELAAVSGSNPIVDATQFTNTISPQTIYVRAENNTTGCFALVNFDVIVNVTPMVTLDANYGACNGDVLVLESGLINANVSYEWFLNGMVITGASNPILTVTVAGTYSVTVTSANPSCMSSSASTNVTFENCVDTDSDGVNDSDEDLNNNGNLDDDDTDMDMIPNYLDDDDDGDNVDTLTEINIVSTKTTQHPYVDTDNDMIENYLDDDDDGDLVLTVNEDHNNNGDPTDDDTDMSGIPDYLESNVTLNIEELNHKVLFSFYPNPTTSILNIKLENTSNGNTSVEILDVLGKVVLQNTISETLQLNVENLKSGLYFVKLKQNNKQTIKKLIIE